MNAAAARLGLEETTYADPIGLDARATSPAPAIWSPSRSGCGATRSSARSSTPRGSPRRSGARPATGSSTATPWCSRSRSSNGVKTGTTLEAGYVLVASGRAQGRRAGLGAARRAERGCARCGDARAPRLRRLALPRPRAWLTRGRAHRRRRDSATDAGGCRWSPRRRVTGRRPRGPGRRGRVRAAGRRPRAPIAPGRVVRDGDRDRSTGARSGRSTVVAARAVAAAPDSERRRASRRWAWSCSRAPGRSRSPWRPPRSSWRGDRLGRLRDRQ